MKFKRAPILTLVTAAVLASIPADSSFASLTNGLVGYWPLDQITGCSNRTPELLNGYDLQPYFGTAHTLTNFGPSTVYLTNDSIRGNAMYWPNPPDGNNRSLLGFISVNTNDLVPVNRSSSSNFTVSFWVKTDGTKNDHRLWTEGNINNNNPGIDIAATGTTWDFFVRQQGLGPPYLEQGNSHTIGSLTAFDFVPAWHNITLVQEHDGSDTNTATRRVYVDGVLDPIAPPAKTGGLWDLNTFAIGGWLRAAPPASLHLFDGAMDDVAAWNRALTEEEIADYMANGITNSFPSLTPLQIASFDVSLGLVDQGESVTLSWNASPDVTDLIIDNGVGSVIGVSACGAGSIQVVPAGTTVYTLTAIRGDEVQMATVEVQTVSGIAGWDVIDSFSLADVGTLGNQGNWTTVFAGFSGPHNLAQVHSTTSGNRILGLEGDHLASAAFLGSRSIGAGESNTVFFRFYIDPSINVMDTNTGVIPDVDIYLGVGNKQIVDEFNYRSGGNGPELRIYRSNFGLGGPIDLQAFNGVGGSLVGFNYIVVDPEGLQTGKVYNVWIDVHNVTNDVTMQAASYHSVYLQREDQATRTNLFTDFISNDTLGAETYDRLHIAASQNTTPQGTNVVLFDDFYISEQGFNSGVPLPPGGFEIGTPTVPSSINVTDITRTGNSVTIEWETDPAGSFSFSVARRSSLSEGTWQVLQSGITENSYTDTTATADQFYYRVTSP